MYIKMKFSVIFLMILYLTFWFHSGLCIAVALKTNLQQPCWLLKERGGPGCSGYAGYKQEIRPDIKKIFKDFYKQFTKEIEKRTKVLYPDSSVPMDWFTAVIRNALASADVSSAEKRKFDSIGYRHRIGFGR